MPQHLMDPIIKKAERGGGRKAIASMRLTSKSWHAAVKEHPGVRGGYRVKRQADLVRLSKAMPNLIGVEIRSTKSSISLKPLAALSKLMGLWITGANSVEDGNLSSAILSGLPSSLKKLHLRNIHVPPDCLQASNLDNLTAISIETVRNKEDEIWQLLACLPKLKVDILHPAHDREGCVHDAQSSFIYHLVSTQIDASLCRKGLS